MLEGGSRNERGSVMEKESLKAAAEEKGLVGGCPFCRQGSWAPGESTYLVQALDSSGSVEAGRGFHAAAIICTNCGFIRLHHTDFLGV
jgi:hypothetical protein